MNLVEGYQEKRVTVVTTNMNGITHEKEIFVGNSKGILLIKAGDQEHQCSHGEMYDIHRTICESFKNKSDEENIICTVPYYVSIEYIKI